MRKAYVILMALLLSISVTTLANPVDVNIAQSVGAKFLTANTKVQLRGNDLQLAKTYSINRGDAAFYIFNAPNGFVIVSADDCAYPILGYSDNGRQFDINNIPIQLQDVLQEYQDQIQYAVENNLVADEKTAEQWRMVKATGKLSNNRDNTQVGPLLTTTWDQGQYYNAMCPEDENGPDGHCVTGCVATAMAQIIKYWGYPEQGRGSHSYNVSGADPGSFNGNVNTTGYGTLYVDFENATYDYNNMPNVLNDESTQEEIDAVAQLMYHCGVAVNMMYSAGESGAQEEDVRCALISYFGYIQSLGYAQRQMYSDGEWADTLRANINRGEPVLYCGRSIFAAHAFVLDGYNQDDFYHFNFGWGGDGDGWFQTSAIYPSFSFNEWQSAIMGIRPNGDSHNIICQKQMGFQNIDNFMVSEPVHLYTMRAGSEYKAVNEMRGVGIDLNLVPENSSGQLVLDVLDFGMEQSVVIYDGVNKDSLVRVIETRHLDDYTTVTYHTWLYDGLPSDTVFQNMAGTDFSPIVSTRHGFTVVVYSYGGMPESFHLQVRNSTDINPNTPCIDNIYWTDIVTSEPDGYLLDGDTIRISSAEGLAWLSHCIDYIQYSQLVISIENDIDLGGYLWMPISLWGGNVNGNGHVIQNMVVSASSNGGLFSLLGYSDISDLGMINAKVNSVNAAGTIAGYVSNCKIENCYSIQHIVNSGNSQGGGLIGSANYGTQINNCYAYGNVCAQFGCGGLVGYLSNSEVNNCVTQLGEIFNWFSLYGWTGLITEEVHGGTFSNCFSDISIAKRSWTSQGPEYDYMAKRAYFLGNVYNVDAIENLAAFNIFNDPTGTLIADTAVNYTFDDHMDVITALNNKVAEYNSPNLRTWVRDEVTHMPVFSDFYEVTCPNVSNITAENIPYNGSFAVALSWQENGDAEEWQVKYNIKNAPEEDAVIITTNTTQNTLEGLSLGNEYSFYVRPICGEETIGWGRPLNFVVDKMLWIDAVTYCPAGYSEDSNGNVTISSPEGLAWLAKMGFDYRQDTVFIISDLDMGAYKWTPICRYNFQATIEGNNHTISNLYCKEDIRDDNSRYIGLIGQARNASLKNIIIENGSFEGNAYVGSLFGVAFESTVVNCHAVNVVAKGTWTVGGLGGIVSSDGGACITYNCSATGEIYGDQAAGGLLGGHSYAGIMTNCYSNCDVRPFGYGNIYEGRGGLCGSACGNIYNCYSTGTVLGHELDYVNSVGSFMGYFNYGELKNIYATQLEDYSFIGKAEYDYIISDTASLSNAGIMNNEITIAETSYTDLLDALNAWVDANNTNDEYLHWVADTNNENDGFPMLERLPATTAQISSLTTGWNWWSTYIEQEGASGLTELESSLGNDGLYIKTQTMSVQNYYPSLNYNYWYGSLSSIQNTSGYMIKMSADKTIALMGTPADPADHPITLQPNWNWIGYPVGTAQTVGAAMSGFTPSANDVIKRQNASSTYYAGYGWFPEFTMTPGVGYYYKSTANEAKTLTFTESRGITPETDQYERYWANDVHAYADNMTVIATVAVNGEEIYEGNIELGAFVNGENRGSVKLEYFEPLDRYFAVLTVNADEGEQITFGIVNRNTNEENFNCSQSITFTRNAVVGILDNPITLDFTGNGFTSTITMYPNPVKKNETITLDVQRNTIITEIVVTDMLGKVIARECGDIRNLSGISEAGVYNIQILTDSGNINKLIIVQ
ncbi:MAG: thiol protease/hemagglutinin PrtT [Bacteroidales bacterium]|nr:thiol protease/hemagglutinin PrtT [Bacteroidales bacterium]